MKKLKIIIILIILCSAGSIYAQKVFTKNGNISFFSKAVLENISANNNQVIGILNQKTGELIFSVIIKSFHFKKNLMEEHFNEDYMESDKYPKSTFKGKITDPSRVDFSKDGNYTIAVSGELTIHGITKTVSAPGVISIKKLTPTASSTFSIKLADYNIKIPALVRGNISEHIEITINCTYDQNI